MALQRDTLLGLVFFGGLALVGWATVSLSNLSFQPRPTFDVLFPHAHALRRGDPVYVLGKRFGEVRAVALDTTASGSPIRVTVVLDEPLTLGTDWRIEVRDVSLLGGSQIDIDPGRPDATPAAPPYLGTVRDSALDKLGESDVAGTLQAAKAFFDKLLDPTSSVGALLASREAFDDLAGILHSARRSVEQVESGEGPLGQVIYSREMAADLAAAVADLRDIAHKIDEGTGFVARLLNDADLAADAAGAVADLKDLTGRARRGQGMLGRILADEQLATDFGDLVASLGSVGRKLDDPQSGLLPALIGDREMRDDAARAVANIGSITDKINSGSGMFGRLVNDEQLVARLERVLDQVAGAIEDAREAAPIGTFFQVLAAPF